MNGPAFDPQSLAGQTLIAITPLVPNRRDAARSAWEVARAALRHTDRVALVDLSLDEPVLDAGAEEPHPLGIVDAFEQDLPLNEVVLAQPDSGLFYIGVGSVPERAEEVWAHPRWPKLARGFASQGATLLLFVPPAAIASLAVEPQGIVVVADHLGDVDLAAVRAWTDGGIPILGILPAVPVVAPRRLLVDVSSPGRRRGLGLSGRRGFGAVATAAAAAAVIASSWLGSRDVGGAAEAREAAASTPVPAPAPVPSPAPGDSLFYSLQVAAYDRPDRAWAYAARLDDAVPPSHVTPVRLASGAWYRVLVGASPSPRVADSLLRSLWEGGLVETGHGTILRTPQAFDLGARDTWDAAIAEVRRLRDQGVPAYALGTRDGRARILVGAFEAANQVAMAESLMHAAGLTAPLAPRTGRAP